VVLNGEKRIAERSFAEHRDALADALATLSGAIDPTTA